MTLQAFVRLPDGSVGGEIDKYTQLQLVPRFNAIGSWALDVPFDGDLTSTKGKLLLPKAGLIVKAGKKEVMSGPVTKPLRAYEAGSGTLSIGGTDDLISLEDRQAHQDPAHADSPAGDNTYFDAEDDFTGPAETAIKHWVDVNAGIGAIGAREGLTIEPDEGRGATTHWSGRMQNLLDLVVNQANAAGLGVRVRQSGAVRVFSMFVPADKTDDVVFSLDLTNLEAFAYGAERPTANVAYVGGGGVGAARVFVVVIDSASVAQWGRIETFVDQGDTTDIGKLTQAGKVALQSMAAKYSFSGTALETGTHQWTPLASSSQESYDVGDRVTVSVDGSEVTEVIREITITNDANGTTVEPTIGSTGKPEKNFYEGVIRSLRAGQRDLQRR